MDWADSEELMEIYFFEVDGRSANLVRGADQLAAGTLDPADHPELVRDAHTLKGSSRMVGKEGVGKAAESLERAWKHVQNANAIHSPVLGSAMRDVAVLLQAAAREPEAPSTLRSAAGRLDELLDDDGGGEPHQAPRATSASDLSAEALISAEPPRYDPAEHSQPTTASRGLVEQLRRPIAPLREMRRTSDVTLGGLLPSLETDLEATVMRVDTGSLYAMINRVVEVGIELESMDALSVVSMGHEPARLLEAFRTQISRVARELVELQTDAVSLVDAPLAEAIETFPQFVRFLGRRLGKEIRFETKGSGVQVDRQIVDLLREPLRHLVVNAVDHGIETPDERLAAGKPRTGTVRLAAEIEEDRLVVTVSDDGRGVDWEAVRSVASSQGLPTSPSELRSHLLRPGFTTVEAMNDFSGTGEGLAMLADAVDRVSGSVMIHSVDGGGLTVMVDMPASLVLQRIVTVAAGDTVVGMAEAAVLDTAHLTPDTVRETPTGLELMYETERIPLIRLSDSLGYADTTRPRIALIVSTRSGLVAVAVTEILGQRRLAVKNVGPILDAGGHLQGAAFLGGGQVLVVVDHNHLGLSARARPDVPAHRPSILVVDDSAGVRQLIGATLRGNGFEVDVAGSAGEAMALLDHRTFDAMVVDYSMPGSNGAEFVASIRNKLKTLPIVMVSGVADQREKSAAWEAGVDAYLDKYDLRQGALTESIQRLLAERAPRHA